MSLKPLIPFDKFAAISTQFMEDENCDIKIFIGKKSKLLSKNRKGIRNCLLEIDDEYLRGVVEEKDDFPTVITDIRRGKGDMLIAAAIHYRFHYDKKLTEHAWEIDKEAFGRRYFEINDGQPVFAEVTERNEAGSLFQRRKQEIDDGIQRRLKYYFESAVLEDFDDFVRLHAKGIWLLSSGPGTGKSTIMAALAQKYAKICEKSGKCFAYFFEYEPEDEFQNTPIEFYKYLFSWIHDTYDHPMASLPEEINKLGELLENVLFRIASDKKISRTKPLFLFVDSLDEISRGEAYTSDNPNPLRLRKNLPEGVYFAHSVRISEAYPHHESRRKKMPPFHSECQLVGSNKHESTVRKYVWSICEKHKDTYLSDFKTLLNSPNGKQAAKEYVDSLCEETKYNFMILRCSLNDKNYWLARGTPEGIPAKIEDFYQKNFERMADGRINGAISRAILSCVLKPRISRYHFLKLNSKGVSESELLSWLDSWLLQGLLEQDQSQAIDWLYVYHRTYQEFLDGKFRRKDVIWDIERLVENLTPLAPFHIYDGESSAILRTELIELTIDLAKRHEEFNTLRRVLLDRDIWNFLASREGGMATISSRIGYFNVSSPTNRSIAESFCSELASQVKKWLLDGLIFNRHHKRPYNVSEFTEIFSGGFVTSSRNSVRFLEYLEAEGVSNV